MAQATTVITFGAFRLDPYEQRLWKGDQPVALQPRPLAVLCYLATRPGVVVSRDELIRALWAGTCVTRAVLKVAVRPRGPRTSPGRFAPVQRQAG